MLVTIRCNDFGDPTMRHLTELIDAIRYRITMRTSTHDDSPDHMTSSQDARIGDPVRRGELVELRRHVSGNQAAFIRWYQDREIAEVLRHDLEPLTEHQARVYFDTIVMPQSSRGTCWALHLASSGQLIGSTAITDIDTRRMSGLFRIVIGEKSVWGKGVGTEATRLVIEESFEVLGLQTVNLEVFGHNERARRAYRRVGFIETGRHVEWVERHHRQINVIEMALSRSGRDGVDDGDGTTH